MRTSLRAVLLLISTFSLVSCGAYLHDPQLKSSTAEMKASFDGLATPAMFAAQRANLKAGAEAEDSAVAAYAVALRNHAILSLLRPSGRVAPSVQGMERLRELVAEDMQQVYGNRAPSPTELRQMEVAPERLLHTSHRQREATRSLARATSEFLRLAPNDQRSVDCASVPPAERDANGSLMFPTSPVDRQYANIRIECARLRSPPLLPQAGGDITQVQTALDEARANRRSAEADAARLRQEVKAALDAQAGRTDGTSPELSTQIEPLVGRLETASALAKSAGLEEVARVLEDRIVAELRSAVAVPTDNARAAAAFRLIGATRSAAAALDNSERADRAGALLTALAMVRHRMNIANLEVSQQERDQGLLERQLAALYTRASHLARAHLILSTYPTTGRGGFADLRSMTDTRERTAVSEALTSYLSAWNSGEIPYQVLRYRAVQASRMDAVQRAELTEQDYRAVLKPAIDAMAAYGAGGITTETIVTLLGHLGIAGSILGR